MTNKVLYMTDTETLKWTHNGTKYCLFAQRDDDPMNPRREWDNLCVLAMFHSRYSLGDDIAKDAHEFWTETVRQLVGKDKVFDAAIQGKIPGVRIEKTGDDEYDIYETYCTRIPFGKSETSESLEYQGIEKATAGCYIMSDLTIQQCMNLLEPYIEWKPIWMYEHGGISISCGERIYPYNDQWDSSCVGWAIAFKERMLKECCRKVLDENGNPIREEHKHEGGPSTYSYKSEPLTEETWREEARKLIDGEVETYDWYLRGETYYYTLYEEQPAEEGEEPDWEELYAYCGCFYGSNILENGIVDEVGNGLAEAIEAGQYEKSEAKRETVVRWKF